MRRSAGDGTMARSRTHSLWSPGARRCRQSANGAIGRHQYVAFVHDDVRTGQRACSYALQYLAYFLIVVAVGGLGSIRGPFVAALLLGIADTGFKYLLPEFGAFFIYALTMAILLWRPRGLFGRA